ncbi:putative RTX toxin acyltransferase family protein [Pelagibacter phage HTVC112P]|jgi:hemolysin-activating ACP:hemolysin acyltransferase|nr:putative RTX toxin acyltransferase family protein [Pelagibacter phage HTVC112P]|tara:strand:- start:1197 stop:1583 length:387 start_codon:yes stop_codon:yes gene_type:complete
MQDVINLFNNFDRYKGKELTNYLEPSIKLNQYKKFYDNNELVGFVNWAYIHDLVEKRFKQTGKIKSNEWNSGSNLWLIEIVSVKNTFKMMRWVYNYFRKQLKVDHSINWLRVDSDIYRVGQKFKRSYH